MVAFYKHDIPAWMDGTEGLTDGAYRAYHVIIQLIYLNEGPITLNEHGIAGRCRQSLRGFRRNLDELITKKKLALDNGRLHNSRADQELEKIDECRMNAINGGINSGKSRNRHAKALKNNNADEATLQKNRTDKTRLEKTREEKKDAADAAPADSQGSQPTQPEPTTPQQQTKPQSQRAVEQPKPDLRIIPDAPASTAADLERDLYSRGKRILGANAGGLIAKLVKARGCVELARASIEMAATKQDPREYIGRIVQRHGYERPRDDGIWRTPTMPGII
jgi:uncharacterized protein YdaU (DUF1376 family)